MSAFQFFSMSAFSMVPLSNGPGSSPSPSSPLPSSTGRWLRRLKRLAAGLVVLGLLLLTLYAFRIPFLTGIGQWWVVDGPVSKADEIGRAHV